MCTTALALLAILAQTSPLTADPQAKAQAQELLGQGTKLYAQGDVAGALEKFNAAYAAYASPKLMFNIGQCNRDLSRPVEALEAFEKFLVGAPDSSPDMIADARRSAAQLQKKLGRIQIRAARLHRKPKMVPQRWQPLPRTQLPNRPQRRIGLPRRLAKGCRFLTPS